MPASAQASIRIALGTADYQIAVRRAAAIAAWVMRMKTAPDNETALRELFPRLQELACKPVSTQDELTERRALESTIYKLSQSLLFEGKDLESIIPGQSKIYVAFARENWRAINAFEFAESVEGQTALRRLATLPPGQPLESSVLGIEKFDIPTLLDAVAFTKASGPPHERTLRDIQKALEELGIEFVFDEGEGVGIRIRRAARGRAVKP